MRNNLAVMGVVCTIMFHVQSMSAQTRPIAPDEYIQATSPLRTGGVITGNTVAGTSHQKMITIIQPPGQQSIPSVVPTNASQFRLASTGATSPPIAQQQVPAQIQPQDQSYSIFTDTKRKFLNLRQTAFQTRAPTSNVSAPAPQYYNRQAPATGVQAQAIPVPRAYYQQVVQVPPRPTPRAQLFVPGTSLTGKPIVPQNQLPQNPGPKRVNWASGL